MLNDYQMLQQLKDLNLTDGLFMYMYEIINSIGKRIIVII
jgi:hypothetical protein